MPKGGKTGRGGGRKGGGKKKKPKKKKGAKDWSYYDDYGQEDVPRETTTGGPKRQREWEDSEPSYAMKSKEPSSSEFEDSDSDVDTAYDTLVASSKQIAASSSSIYSRLLRQQSLEEDGKSDESDDSEDSEDEEEEVMMVEDEEDKGDKYEEEYDEEDAEKKKNVKEENLSRTRSSRSTPDDDDDDDDDDLDDDDDDDVSDLESAENDSSSSSSSSSGGGSSSNNISGEDTFVARFLALECDEDTVKRAAESCAASKFTPVETPPGSTLDIQYQSTTGKLPSSTLDDDLTKDFRVKPRVATKWLGMEKKGRRNKNGFTPLQSLLYPAMNQYDDLLYMDRTVRVPKNQNEESGGSGWELREMLSLHIVNHITKARDAVSLHTQQIRKRREARKLEMNANQVKKTLARETGGGSSRSRKRRRGNDSKKKKVDDDKKSDGTTTGTTAKPRSHLFDDQDDVRTPSHQLVQEEHRDQGLSRTRVLVVVPTRSAAERYIKSIVTCLPKTVKTIHNQSRFELEYGLPEMANQENGEEQSQDPEDRAEREREILKQRELTRDGRRRPEDWIELFARNDNDCFTLGMSFSRKEIKMYSDFRSSDLIVASPLGLRMAMGAEGEDEKGKHLDADFLSSIEVLVVDQMEALEMQNWDHVQQMMSYMNQTPKNEAASTIDFSRVREFDLLNLGKHYRQTVFIASHKMPEMTAMAKRACRNVSGVVKVTRKMYHGSITSVVPKVRQLYRRIHCESLVTSDDDRYSFFVKHMFPKLRRICRGLDAEDDEIFQREKEQGTILFIPSYFDFLRIKNLFLEEGLHPALCSEYTETSEQTRNRSLFFHGDQRLLIYTERNHFYNRFRIRGARHLIFYAPPQHASVYPDMLNILSTKNNSATSSSGGNSNKVSGAKETSESDPSVTVLFTKYDALRLERIVGTDRTKRMIKGKGGKTTYLFL